MAFGFIGLGMIGRPMARRLAEVTRDAVIYDVVPAASAELAGIATIATSPRDLIARCDVIAICVRDDADVRAVIADFLGDPAACAGRVILVHSTIGLETLTEMAAKLAAVGAELVDAAVTGGPDVAARGELTMMLGGSDGIPQRVAPLASAYAKKIIHAGPLGAGMKLKVANNLVTYTQLAIGVEALRLATLSGVDPTQLIEVMRSNGNLTTAMDLYLARRMDGAARADAQKFLAFQQGLASLAEKDLDHAIATARASGVPVPIAEDIRQRFRPTVERIDP